MTKVVSLVGGSYQEIPLDKIIEDPFLPRKSYSLEGLESLGDSLGEKGLMQAVVVARREDGFFTLIAGSRRVRAARARGFTHIPATVRDVTSPQEVMILALSENVQREDLEPLEEANAYLWLHQEYDMDLRQIAKSVSRSVARVRNRLKLLDLAPEVLQLIADEELSAESAAVLAHIQSGEGQLAVAQEIVRSRLSIAEVTTLVGEENRRPIEDHASRQLSVQKYRLRLVKAAETMQKGFATIEHAAMTPEERGRLMKVHAELEEASRRIRDKLSQGGRYVVNPEKARKGSGNVPTARSHGQEWPAGDVKLLEDPSLSDEDIAEQIGRNVTAVAAMRKELKRTKRRSR